MLSRSLQDQLEAWESFWSLNFDHQNGWAEGAEREYRQKGEMLCARLMGELGPGYAVTLVV